MVEVNSLLSVIQSAAELARSIEPKNRADGGDDVREIGALIRALRAIYFTPRGVLALLEDIASGERPSREKVEALLPEFNDAEYSVRHYSRHLMDADRLPGVRLSLRAERVLREISYGKEGVRQKVQVLLNEALTFGHEISVEDARGLIQEIGVLNEAIEEAEEKLIEFLR